MMQIKTKQRKESTDMQAQIIGISGSFIKNSNSGRSIEAVFKYSGLLLIVD